MMPSIALRFAFESFLIQFCSDTARVMIKPVDGCAQTPQREDDLATISILYQKGRKRTYIRDCDSLPLRVFGNSDDIPEDLLNLEVHWQGLNR
jgi:hypothetical protein